VLVASGGSPASSTGSGSSSRGGWPAATGALLPAQRGRLHVPRLLCLESNVGRPVCGA
jgi:hypothetical protein